MNRSEAGKLGAAASKITNALRKGERVEEYNRDPRRCKGCAAAIPYEVKCRAGGRKFCSQSCSAVASNAKRERKYPAKYCLSCKKELIQRGEWGQTKFCEEACQREYNRNLYIKKWLSGEIDGGRKGGYVSNYIRSYLKETFGEKCILCGWHAVNPYTKRIPLILDHVDGNCLNNKLNNLRLICSNCDSLTATYKGANKGRGRVSRGVHNSTKATLG